MNYLSASVLMWRKLPMVAFLCLVLNCSLLSAQKSDEADEEKDAIQLGDFVVTVDDGRSYVANNSNSATSFNVALRDLPVPISVVTKQFIEDQGATDFREALSYEAGVSFQQEYNSNSGAFSSNGTNQDRSPSSSANPSDPFANAIIIRGYNSPSQQRLGFRVGASVPTYGVNFGGATDTVNTARQETVYGPQSLLYGINVLSGVVNIIPKQPIGERGGEFRLTLGSLDYYRGSLEYEDIISKENGLYYRVAAAYSEKGDVVDLVNTEERYYVGQLLWEPNKAGATYPKVRVFLEMQYSNKIRTGARGTSGGSKMDSLRMPIDTLGESNGGFDRYVNEQGNAFHFGYDYDPDAVTVISKNITGGADGLSLSGLGGTNALGLTSGYLSSLYPDGVYPVGSSYLVKNPSRSADFYNFPELGDYYNMTGDDQIHDFEEVDVLGLVNLEPFEGLGIELGAYYTATSTYKQTLDMEVQNLVPANIGLNNGYGQNPEMLAALNGSAYSESAPFLSGLEEVFIGERFNELATADSPPLSNSGSGRVTPYILYKLLRYQYSYGKVDSETIQLRARINYNKDTSWFDGRVNANHTFAAGISYIKDQVEFVQPATLGAANNYSLGPQFGGLYNNSSFGNDAVSYRNIFDYSPLEYDPSKMSLMMPGGANFTNLGENSAGELLDSTNSYIAKTGWREVNMFFKGYFGVYYGKFFEDRLTLIAGVRHDSYQVRERAQLTAIQRTTGYTNIDEVNADNPRWFGTAGGSEGWLSTGALLGYGDTEYQAVPWFSDELNAKVKNDYDTFRSKYPNGTTEYNFPEDQEFTSKTAGFSFRVIDPLSLYFIYSEGIFPNTGQIDGAGQAIEAETTTNNEIGIKFELFEGRLSGSASFYEIKRSNATWQWAYAPGPNLWFGGDESVGTAEKTGFNPEAVGTGDATWRYSVALPYVDRVARLIEAKTTNERGTKLSPESVEGFDLSYGATGSAARNTGTVRDGTGYISTQLVADYVTMQDTHAELIAGTSGLAVSDGLNKYLGEYVYLDRAGNILGKDADSGSYHYLVDSDGYNIVNGELAEFNAGDEWDGNGQIEPTEVKVGNPIKLAMDLAVRDQTAPGIPFSYLASASGNNNGVYAHNAGVFNPQGSAAGQIVRYEEKGTGYSFSLNWLIKSNWSLRFDYSYSERKVTGGGFILADGFRLVDGVPVADSKYNGGRYTTEYDPWVYVLGIDNFVDPTNPTTLIGGSLAGLDLSFIPRHNANIWTKYEFDEGRLKGLSIGGGLKYTSSSPTTVAIGGANLAENRYPTPDIAERFQLDGMISYRGEFENGMGYQIQLNVKNIMNDDYVVTYGIPETTLWGDVYTKQSIRFYDPREYRLSFTLTF